jgi:hypothetical protein
MYGPNRTGRANTTPTPLLPKTGALMAKRERLEICAESGFIEKLDRLAKESGTSKAEIIDRAIGLYARALKEAQAGNVIQFVPENEAI